MSIREGEFVSLLGPSGCGKTTILRMVAGLVEPSRGRILIGKDDVTSLPPNKRGLGLVFQRSEAHPSELQSRMRNSYADFCLKNNIIHLQNKNKQIKAAI